MAEGGFRSDLHYALAGTTLCVPPLRERPDDIAFLAHSFLIEAAAGHGKPVHGLSDDAILFLEGHDWPGNMRELENEMIRMLVFSQDAVPGPELISRNILQAAPGDEAADSAVETILTGNGTLKDRVEQVEMRVLRETLTPLQWNKCRAAAELGLSREGLRAKIDRYGIASPKRAGQNAED